MKRVAKFGLTIAALALPMSALAACGSDDSSAASGEVIRMKIGSPLASTHHISVNAFHPWKEIVEEKTDGRVEVEIYDGGTLGSLNSALADLTGGVYDVGIGLPSYFRDSPLFPLTIGTLAFAFPDPATGNEYFSEFFEEHKDEVKVDGILSMGVAFSDNYVFFSKNKVTTVDDVKGKKVKAQGEADAGLVESWGGVPVALTTEETYQGLEKNTIDIAPFSPVAVLGTKFYEVAPYILETNAWGTVAMPMMSEKFYNSLPEDLQKLFDDELNPELLKLLQDSYISEQERAASELPDLVKENGGEISQLAPAELRKFQEAAGPQWNDWIADANSKGFDGQALVDAYTRLMQEAGVTPPV